MKVMLTLILFAILAVAQTALDPTQGGALPKFADLLAPDGAPDFKNPHGYLDHSCGYWMPLEYTETRDNQDGTVTAGFRFKTTCSTGGRGTRPRVFQSCWAVSFSSGVVIDRQRLAYNTWRVPALPDQPAVACPGL